MKIEAGKYYKTESGLRFYVCATNHPGDSPVVGWYDLGGIVSLTAGGKFFGVGKSNHDLVSEWRDELEIPWDKLFPPWVKWFAVDEDGEQCGFSGRPRAGSEKWLRGGVFDGCLTIPRDLRIPFTGDWKESLTERK